jgi:hypothetical protein
MPINHYCKRAALAGTLLLLAMAACGCALPGALAYKFMGPPEIPAKYVFPKIPLLVLVENAHSGSIAIPEADALSAVIYEDLKEHKVAPLIDPARVHELRDRNPIGFGKMSITEVGRQLGAEQVLYVHVQQLDIESPTGADLVRLKISVKVKIVEIANARTIWPESGDTESYNVESPWQRLDPGTTRSVLNHQVLRESGIEIARWFYPYQPDTMMEENKAEMLR